MEFEKVSNDSVCKKCGNLPQIADQAIFDPEKKSYQNIFHPISFPPAKSDRDQIKIINYSNTKNQIYLQMRFSK